MPCHSQPAAFQAAAGEDSKQKKTFEAAKVFFLLSSPVVGPAAWLAHAWCNGTATLSLQPSRQLRVRIANKKRPLRPQRFFCFCYPHPWLALQPGLACLLAGQPAGSLLGLPDGVSPSCVPPGEDSSEKKTFVGQKVFFFVAILTWGLGCLLACLPACLLACLPACLLPSMPHLGEDSKKKIPLSRLGSI